METLITLTDIKQLIRRRAKSFIVIFSLIIIGSMVVAIVLPPIYRSQTIILIEAQQIPDEYVKSTITSYAEQRLEMLTQEILSYKALKEIIQEFGLYPEFRLKEDIGSAVRKMKAAVSVEPISSKVGIKSYTTAFILSYENEDPEKAYAVTDRLSQRYLQKEAEGREKQAAVTTGFLERELSNLKKQIEKHEKEISDFKQRHIGELPESTAANLSSLQRLERELEQINGRIRSLQDRKIYLKGQLANIEPLRPIQTDSGKLASNPQERLKSLRLELIRARARLSDKHPDVIKMTNEIEKLEEQVGQSDTALVKIKQLKALRSELAEVKASKGEKHPDVIYLSKQIDGLGREVDLLLSDSAMTDLSEGKPDNPAYINLMTQIVSADLEIRNLNEDITNINKLISDYQRRVENMPTVEREFSELTIDYKNARARYNEISGQLLQARVSQEMDIRQQGEHFTITDPAYVPTRAAKPNRPAIILLGFVLGIGVGLGVAAFREAMDHTIKSSKDIKAFAGVDLLTVMPYTPSKEERRRNWFRKTAVTVACLWAFCMVLLAVDKLVLPLSSVFSFIIERLVY